MFDRDAGQRRDREGVDLDDVAGLFEGDTPGFSDGVRALSWRCSGGELADQGGNGLNRSRRMSAPMMRPTVALDVA